MDIKKLPKSQVEMKITVPAEELEKFLDLAASDLSSDINVAGFRPGKAPRKIVEQKVGSEKVLAHAAEKAVKKSFVDEITKNKIDTIGEPRITITKIAPGNDLEYKAVVSVMPEIIVGNYRSIAKKTKKPKSEKAKPEEVEKELQLLRKSRAKVVTVRREARNGDMVEIDFEILMDGKSIEGGKSSNHPLTIGENYFIPGFEENLAGMKEAEEKEFELSFPDDYHQKNLAGKPATFKVKMKLVQEKDLPAIDDEFAKSLGNFENMEALKKSIAEGLELEHKKKNEEKWRAEALEKIAAGSQMEIPPALIELETEKMMAEFEHNIASMGMSLDTYLENIKKSKSEVAEGWKETATKRVKAALILREIAKSENIEASASEVEEEMNKVLAYYKSTPDMEKNVDMEKLYNYSKGVLTNEKVFKFLESL